MKHKDLNIIIEELLKYDKEENNPAQVYKNYQGERVYPSLYVTQPNIIHQADVTLFKDSKNKDKYKSILTVIDVHNSLVDARPLKSNRKANAKELIKAFDDIYKHSKYLKYPDTLQTDQGFNFKEFNIYCNEHNIKQKFNIPDCHRQNAFIERFNKYLKSKLILKKEFDKIKDNKRPLDVILKEVIKEINILKINRNIIIKDKKYYHKVRQDTPGPDFKFNNKRVILQVGTRVRRLLYHRLKLKKEIEKDKDALEERIYNDIIRDDTLKNMNNEELINHYKQVLNIKKLRSIRSQNQTKPLNSLDIKWSYTIYKIKSIHLMPNSVVLYKIEDPKTGEEFPRAFTYEQLQVV